MKPHQINTRYCSIISYQMTLKVSKECSSWTPCLLLEAVLTCALVSLKRQELKRTRSHSLIWYLVKMASKLWTNNTLKLELLLLLLTQSSMNISILYLALETSETDTLAQDCHIELLMNFLDIELKILTYLLSNLLYVTMGFWGFGVLGFWEAVTKWD